MSSIPTPDAARIILRYQWRQQNERAYAKRVREGKCVRACGRPAAEGRRECLQCVCERKQLAQLKKGGTV